MSDRVNKRFIHVPTPRNRCVKVADLSDIPWQMRALLSSENLESKLRVNFGGAQFLHFERRVRPRRRRRY